MFFAGNSYINIYIINKNQKKRKEKKERMFRLQFVLLLIIYLCVETLADFQTFGQCIKQTPSPGVISCAGVQALNSLQTIENAENFTLASGLILAKDESSVMSRSIPNFLEQDPMDFR